MRNTSKCHTLLDMPDSSRHSFTPHLGRKVNLSIQLFIIEEIKKNKSLKSFISKKNYPLNLPSI